MILILLPRGSPPAWRELADEICGWLEGGAGVVDGFAWITELAVGRGSSRRELQRAARSLADVSGSVELVLILGEDWLPLGTAAPLGQANVPCLCLPLDRPGGDVSPPPGGPGAAAAPGRSLESLLAQRALGPVEPLEPGLAPEAYARHIVERVRRSERGNPSPSAPLDEDWLCIASEVFEAQRRLEDWGQDLLQHQRDLESKRWLAPTVGRVRRRVRRFLRKRGWI